MTEKELNNSTQTTCDNLTLEKEKLLPEMESIKK